MSQSETSKPVMSGAVKRFLLNRLSELLGLFFLAAAAALMVALATASDADPSLNVATDRVATNLLGAQGALVADILFQAFGFIAFLFPVALASWSYRYLSHSGLRAWYWRMPLLPLGFAFLSAFMVGLGAFYQLSFSAIFGFQLNQAGRAIMHNFALSDTMFETISVQLVTALFFAVIGLPLTIWTAGLTRREWGVAKFILKIVLWPITAPFGLMRRKPAAAKPVE